MSSALKNTLEVLKEVIVDHIEQYGHNTTTTHDPTPTEFFALITSIISNGSKSKALSQLSNDKLPELLIILAAVIPQSSVIVIKQQLKLITMTLLAIVQVNGNVTTQDGLNVTFLSLSCLSAVMIQSFSSNTIHSSMEWFKGINCFLTFLDCDENKIRKLSHHILIKLMNISSKFTSNEKDSAITYISEFCLEVLKSCTRNQYRRPLCVIIFLESSLSSVASSLLLQIIQTALQLQVCEVPKLTAAVYRMLDSFLQTKYYSAVDPQVSDLIDAVLPMILSNPVNTADMEANTHFWFDNI